MKYTFHTEEICCQLVLPLPLFVPPSTLRRKLNFHLRLKVVEETQLDLIAKTNNTFFPSPSTRRVC